MEFLHIFGQVAGAPSQPEGPLLRASDGNFYGYTLAGGRRCPQGRDCGTLYRVSPSGQVSLFHEFGDAAELGFFPTGPLTEAPDGALVGVALAGPGGGGVVYRITTGGQYRVLAGFSTDSIDGATPIGRLAVGPDGSVYGVTNVGGGRTCPAAAPDQPTCGTLFRVTPDGVKTILHSFGGSATEPALPTGVVYNPVDGNFYGTTLAGGGAVCQSRAGETSTSGCGTIFRYNARDGLTVVHRFSSAAPNGIAPQAAPVVAPDGTMYGATASGGSGTCDNLFGCGTIYRFTPGGQFSLLHEFGRTGAIDGFGPSPYVALGADGNLYGTTVQGGAIGISILGTIWRVTPGGVFTRLFSFGPRESAPFEPLGGLVEAQPNVFLGVTRNSPSLGGTLFRATVR